MENHALDPNSKEALRQRLAPPAETSTSLVLNGIGNGMMVGIAPFMAMEMYANISGRRDISRGFHVANAVATVAGVVFGGFFGLREARKLHEYRQTIGTEMANLSERVTDNTERTEKWVDKLDKHAAGADISQIGR